MKNIENATLLRIFINSSDKFKHTPLYEVAVYAAKRYGLAGATVLKGVMGYGASSYIYSRKFWEVADSEPMVIEIVDNTEKIERFYENMKPYFDKIKNGCLITMEDVQLVLFKHEK